MKTWIELPKRFNPEQTFTCGQCFRWKRVAQDEKTIWQGITKNSVLQIYEMADSLGFNCSVKEFAETWKSYFDWEEDYACIQVKLSNAHPVMRQAIAFAPGLRVLHQDPWETICTFTLSSNNNIARITGIVERLSMLFGVKLEMDSYAFPAPEVLANLSRQDLEPIKAGYRAEYLIDAAKKVASGQINLQEIEKATIDEGRRLLQQIRGVGPKVAECILLYGFGKKEAFPLDVWMKRAMETLFPGQTQQIFGDYAGIAQQYIFHYSRLNSKLFHDNKKSEESKAR